MLFNLVNKSYCQVSDKNDESGTMVILIDGSDLTRIIADSIYGGKISIETEIDTVTKTLQFKRVISGNIFIKKLNSKTYGYDISRNKKVPQQFEMIIPEIEKELKSINLIFPQNHYYERSYSFIIQLK